jgi:hypothetical protein
MDESITSWLQNMFGGSGTGSTVPATPGMTGTNIGTNASANTFNTDSLNTGMSGLQLGQLGLSGLSSLFNGYLGYQNMQTAKSQANQAQNNWNKQWAANVKTTNASLSDRQAARVASNPNAYTSVSDYMNKYGIS